MAYKVSVKRRSLSLNEKLMLNWLAITSQPTICLWISSCIYHACGISPKVCMNMCTQSSFGTFSFSHFFVQISKCFWGSKFPLYFTFSCGRSPSCLNISLIFGLIVSHSHKVLRCAPLHLAGVACNAISNSRTLWFFLIVLSTLKKCPLIRCHERLHNCLPLPQSSLLYISWCNVWYQPRILLVSIHPKRLLNHILNFVCSSNWPILLLWDLCSPLFFL